MLVQSQKISALMIKREAFVRQQTALLGGGGARLRRAADMLTLIADAEKETGEEMRERSESERREVNKMRGELGMNG